jgi:cobalt-zinc-cadmium efflux system outer membrane protein
MMGPLPARWALPLFGSLLLLAPLPVMAEPPDPLTLDWCLQEAERANPDLAVDQALAEAAEHRVGYAGSLEDPRIQYEASNVPIGDFDFSSTPMSGHQIRLAQKFPFPGVLGNRKGAARAAAKAASSDLADRGRRVAAAVEQAYARLGLAQRALEITDRNIDLLRQLTRIAETKYEVGKGLQQDVLRAQVELSRLLDERLRREEEITQAAAALNALLDRPADLRLPRTAALAETAPLPKLGALLARLEAVSPGLRALKDRIEAAERLRRATKREGYPDFDLGVGYRFRRSSPGDPVGGDDFLGAGVTIRLPVNRGKWHEMVAERSAEIRRAEAAYRARRASLRERIRSSFAQLERADGEVALLETGLVPQARQSMESSRAGYQVDKVDFLSLIDSQLRLLDTELRLLRAQADRRSAFASLEEAFGESVR